MKKVSKNIIFILSFFTFVSICSLNIYAETNEETAAVETENNGKIKKSAKNKSDEKKAKKAAMKAEKAAAKNAKNKKDTISDENDESYIENTEDSGSLSDYVRKETSFKSKTIDISSDKMKVLMKGSVGSFQFYSVDEDKGSTPLLAGYDEFTSSFYSLKVGKKIYKLTNNIGVIIGSRFTDNGGQMVYVVPNVARLLVSYEIMPSSYDASAPQNILKITANVSNRGRKTNTFALKTVLDTYLGEQKGPHFSTANISAINSEMQFRKFDEVKWICSENNNVSMQILLAGADISVPEVVSLSNKDLLSLPAWVPQTVATRTFDSVLSYNNSGLCINWNETTLAPNEEKEFVYYIVASNTSEKPDIDRIVIYMEKRLADLAAVAEQLRVKKADEDARQGFNNSTFKFDPDKLSAAQLDPEYIKRLIERINDLEKETDKIDRNELLRLNSELDAILIKLRQM